jgi:signal transduction protein with GAF and PtsI domain
LCGEKLAEPMAQRGDIVAHGNEPSDWMDVPFIVGEQSIGVMVVQTYDDTHYSAAEKEQLEFTEQQLLAPG